MRDRIIELRRVPAAELRPNPRNWRLHPPAQVTAMRGMLERIGLAGAVLARRLDDGSLELIDGHLRAELAASDELPVLVLDVDETEAAALLASYDPLSALAQCDSKVLDELMADVAAADGPLGELLRQIHCPAPPEFNLPDIELPQLYSVVVQCRDEQHQREVYELVTQAGHACRLTVM